MIGSKKSTKTVEQPVSKGKKFAARVVDMCNKLEFTVTEKRSWKKRYPIDNL